MWASEKCGSLEIYHWEHLGNWHYDICKFLNPLNYIGLLKIAHVLTKTNWGHFIEGIFKLIFLNEYCIILIKIFLKLSSDTFDNKCDSFVLDNGLAPNRQQKAVIWTRI